MAVMLMATFFTARPDRWVEPGWRPAAPRARWTRSALLFNRGAELGEVAITSAAAWS